MRVVDEIKTLLGLGKHIEYSDAVELLESGRNNPNPHGKFTYQGEELSANIPADRALEMLQNEEPEDVTYIPRVKGYRLVFEYSDKTQVIETGKPHLSNQERKRIETKKEEKADIQKGSYSWG